MTQSSQRPTPKSIFHLDYNTRHNPRSGNTAFVQSVEQIIYIQSPQQNLSNNNNKKQNSITRTFQASSSYFSCTHNLLQVLPHKTIWRLKPVQCDLLVSGRERARHSVWGNFILFPLQSTQCLPLNVHLIALSS